MMLCRCVPLLALALLLAACRFTQEAATSTPPGAITGMTVAPATLVIATQPPVTVLTEPRAPVCPNAPPLRLIVYERGQVTYSDESLNLRAGPGTGFRILRRMPPGSLFFVIGGPECGSSYAWFRVRYEDLEGWIAEGDASAYYAQPYLPG